MSEAVQKRFPEALSCEIFEHFLNRALNNRMVDPGEVFIDGTHIKASANRKSGGKVNAEREKLGEKPIEDGDDETFVFTLRKQRFLSCMISKTSTKQKGKNCVSAETVS